MSTPTLPNCNVVLTGARAGDVSEAELLRRLQERFRLEQAQATALLGGRRIVKRDVDAVMATKLIRAFQEIGLVAVAEPLTGAPAQASPALPPVWPAVPVPAPERPRPMPVDPENTMPVSPIDRLRAVAGMSIPPPDVSRQYSMQLAQVSALCLAIPVLYAVLTGGLALAWLWYLTHIHQHLPTHHWRAVLLLYAVPGLTGGVLLLFLLRPLFMRRPARPAPVTVDRETEPELVEGIQSLCTAIGVAPPGSIHLTWEVNAWVAFRHGWRGLLNNDKSLTIGVPLLSALTARELVGVLAHEFGHFAQRAGMTGSWIINSVNAWLEYRAFGRDPWEERVERAAQESEEWYVVMPARLAWLAIQGVRKLMAVMFRMSVRRSSGFSRQMEFDADRYEAIVAGSDAFAGTARKLRALSEAFDEVNRANITAWQEGRLLRDLPEAVALHFRSFDAQRLQALAAEDDPEPRYWDSHPPDRERIANAEALEAPGLFRDGAPAARLVRDVRGWSAKVTRAFYDDMRLRYQPEQLRSREEVMGLAEGRDYSRELVDRYFNAQFQPWPLLDLSLNAGTAEGQGWQGAIDVLRRRSPEFTAAWLAVAEAEEQLPRMRAAIELDLDSQQLELPGSPRGATQLRAERERIVGRKTSAHQLLVEAFELYSRRILCAVDAMREPDRSVAAGLRALLVELHAQEAHVAAVAELTVAAGLLEQALRAGVPNAAERLATVGAEYATHLLALMDALDKVRQTVTAGETIGGYVRTRCPFLLREGGNRAPEALLRTGTGVPDALRHFYRLALGELVVKCTAAETANRIRPIRLIR